MAVLLNKLVLFDIDQEIDKDFFLRYDIDCKDT